MIIAVTLPTTATSISALLLHTFHFIVKEFNTMITNNDHIFISVILLPFS